MRAYKTVTSKCSKTSYKIDNLMEGLFYYFRVLPENIYGIGEPCEHPDAILVCEVPLPPQKLEVIDVTKTSVILGWEKPEHDGGSRLTGYVIEAFVKMYLCLLADVPGPPGRPTVFDVSRDGMTVAWNPPEEDGGLEVSGYIIERKEVRSDRWVRANKNPYTLTSMPQGEEFKFRVMACNAGGSGEPAEVPGTVKITEMLGENLNMTLTAPELTIFTPIIEFFFPPSLLFFRDGSAVSTAAMIASTEDTSELVIKGAERSDSGIYELLLENKVGRKKAQIKVKVIGRPGAPQGPLVFDEVQANSVKVSWKAPSDNGGSDILGYIVERREATRNAWYTVDSRVTDTQLVVKGLKEGAAYHFKVTAENSFGISASLKTAICIKTKFNFFLKPNCVLSAEAQPSLRKEIDEVTTKLGQPAIIKCQIIGRPVPEIKWYHDGKEILESRKYEMSSDGRNHSLTVMTDRQEDEGEYTCKAINDAGEAQTTGVLVLEAAPSFHPDYLLKETYHAGLGTTLRIHAVYIGRPEPKIMWLHGAKTLENTDDISIETTEHYTHLIIKNVQRRVHGGKYRIRLHNHFGRADTAFNVEIYGMSCDYPTEGARLFSFTLYI
uniref:Titin n=1 Tax=Cynoglossus semilaevis TaxID=244447 RepID=A0A3P8WE53_CYNSE